MGGYSLGAIFFSEFLGMTLTIFLGEGILANELLQSTKGHGLGFLAVAIGFGLAFGVNIAWFSWISAHLNPGMFFFLAIQGELDQGWTECVVGTIADFLGAFVGGCLVWLFFLPHFGSSLPLPPDNNDVATLLYGPSTLDENAGRLASAFGNQSRPEPDHPTTTTAAAAAATVGPTLSTVCEDGLLSSGVGGGYSNQDSAQLPSEQQLQQQQPETPPLSRTATRRMALRKLFGTDGTYDDAHRESLLEKMEMIHDRRQTYKIVPLDEVLSKATNVTSVIAPKYHGTIRSVDSTASSGSVNNKKDGGDKSFQRSNSINVATLDHEHDVDSSGIRPHPSYSSTTGAMNNVGKEEEAAAVPSLSSASSYPNTAGRHGLQRRHSAQIAALLHKHDPYITDPPVEGVPTSSMTTTTTVAAAVGTTMDGRAVAPTSTKAVDTEKEKQVTIQQETTTIPPSAYTNGDSDGHNHDEEMGGDSWTKEKTTTTAAAAAGGRPPVLEVVDKWAGLSPQQISELTKRRETYEASIRADSAAKLSIFATRPAIYHRPYNFLQETLASAVLFFGAEMFKLSTQTRQEQSNNSSVITSDEDPLMTALWVSLFITLLVLGLGGVTGLACNPARDIGPRFAHWVLPFPNKGPSEWHYGLAVPLGAPYVGACIAAGLYQIMLRVFNSREDSPPMDEL